jgi:hypothetical protein
MPLSIPTFSYSTRFFVTSLSCEPSERAEAEGRRPTSEEGYRGHADKIKCPGNDVNPAENGVM